MTVGELKKKLEDVDDSTPVVTHGSDHSYNTVGFCGVTSAEGSKHGECFEFFNEENMSPGSTEILVFLISDM